MKNGDQMKRVMKYPSQVWEKGKDLRFGKMSKFNHVMAKFQKIVFLLFFFLNMEPQLRVIQYVRMLITKREIFNFIKKEMEIGNMI